jgi:hypothetical protein
MSGYFARRMILRLALETARGLVLRVQARGLIKLPNCFLIAAQLVENNAEILVCLHIAWVDPKGFAKFDRGGFDLAAQG